MSKKDKKQLKKQQKSHLVEKKTRADGSEEYVITKAPQETIGGKIIICILAALLGGSAIVGLIFVLCQL